jgi:hypothetical protein
MVHEHNPRQVEKPNKRRHEQRQPQSHFGREQSGQRKQAGSKAVHGQAYAWGWVENDDT